MGKRCIKSSKHSELVLVNFGLTDFHSEKLYLVPNLALLIWRGTFHFWGEFGRGTPGAKPPG
jgi:hypothetical protein